MLSTKLLVIFVFVLSEPASAVGPDIQAKERLLRDLPLGFAGIKNIPPRETDRTLIDMSLSIRSLDLDFQSGEFRTDGWMSLRWHDSRYEWNPDEYDGITSLTLPFSDVWAPEVILHNSIEEKFAFRQIGLVKNSGEFVYILSVHSKSGCEPNYDNFPFGIQLCQLKFGSWINEHYKVEYRIEPNATVALDDFFSPTGWKMVASDAHLESKRHPLFEEPSHTVVYNLVFRRDTYFDPATGKLLRRVRGNKSVERLSIILNVTTNKKCKKSGNKKDNEIFLSIFQQQQLQRGEGNYPGAAYPSRGDQFDENDL